MPVHRLPDQPAPAEGELVPITIGDRRLVVLSVEGSVYALDDECTHQQCSLATGELEDSTLICPCHFAEYDVRTGEVLGGPAPRALQTYAANVIDGELELEIPT